MLWPHLSFGSHSISCVKMCDSSWQIVFIIQWLCAGHEARDQTGSAKLFSKLQSLYMQLGHTESTDMKTNIRVRSIISRHFPLCIRVTDVLVHDGCIFASYSQWKTLLYYSEENKVLCHIWSKRSDIAFAHSTTYRQKIEVNLCMDVCILLQSILSKASCKYK